MNSLFNRGLMLKAFRETWTTTLLLGCGLCLVEVALSFVLPKFEEQAAAQWLKMPFVQNIIKAMLGAEVGDTFGPETFGAMAWVHPVFLALAWAHAIIYCTRIPAGEVDRGTVDVLLGLPVSRWEIYLSETVVWIFSAAILLAFAFAGNTLGSLALAREFPLARFTVFMVLANFLCMYLAVGGLTLLVSGLSNRRGRAINVVFLTVLASFLLNYLVQFWAPVERIAFLSVLHYYQPLSLVRLHRWPLADMAILSSAAAILWVAGGVVFSRRDLMTV